GTGRTRLPRGVSRPARGRRWGRSSPTRPATARQLSRRLVPGVSGQRRPGVELFGFPQVLRPTFRIVVPKLVHRRDGLPLPVLVEEAPHGLIGADPPVLIS